MSKTSVKPENRIQPGDGDWRHGTTGGYSNHECSCDLCREAWRVYLNSLRYHRQQRGLAPEDPRHGKYTTYGNYRCRCDRCTDAWKAYNATLPTRARVP